MKKFIVAALFVSTAALAREDAFNTLDLDKDEKLTPEEAAADADLAAQFAALDKKPKDGKLTKDEYKPYFHAKNARGNRGKGKPATETPSEGN